MHYPQVQSNIANRRPDHGGMLDSPDIMSHNREPIAGQVKALSTVPGRIECELNAASTGWPASVLERQTVLDIPQLRGRRSLWVIAALKAKGILVWCAFLRCGSDRDEGVRPLDGQEPPAAAIHSALEWPSLDM